MDADELAHWQALRWSSLESRRGLTVAVLRTVERVMGATHLTSERWHRVHLETMRQQLLALSNACSALVNATLFPPTTSQMLQRLQQQQKGLLRQRPPTNNPKKEMPRKMPKLPLPGAKRTNLPLGDLFSGSGGGGSGGGGGRAEMSELLRIMTELEETLLQPRGDGDGTTETTSCAYDVLEVIVPQTILAATEWAVVDQTNARAAYLGRHPEYDCSWLPEGPKRYEAKNRLDDALAEQARAELCDRGKGGLVAPWMLECLVAASAWQDESTVAFHSVSPNQAMFPGGQDWAARHLMRLHYTLLLTSFLAADYDVRLVGSVAPAQDGGQAEEERLQEEETLRLFAELTKRAVPEKRLALSDIVAPLGLQPATLVAAARGTVPWLVSAGPAQAIPAARRWARARFAAVEQQTMPGPEGSTFAQFGQILREAADVHWLTESATATADRPVCWPTRTGFGSLQPALPLGACINSVLQDLAQHALEPTDDGRLLRQALDERSIGGGGSSSSSSSSSGSSASGDDHTTMLANLLAICAQQPLYLGVLQGLCDSAAEGSSSSGIDFPLLLRMGQALNDEERKTLAEICVTLLFHDLVQRLMILPALPGGNKTGDAAADAYGSRRGRLVNVRLYQSAHARFVHEAEMTLSPWMHRFRSTVYQVAHSCNLGIVNIPLSGGVTHCPPRPSEFLRLFDAVSIVARLGLFHAVLLRHHLRFCEWRTRQTEAAGSPPVPATWRTLLGRFCAPFAPPPTTQTQPQPQPPDCIYEGQMLTTVLDAFGNTTVGAACYADLLSVLGVVRKPDAMAEFVTEAALHRGVSASHVDALHREGAILARTPLGGGPGRAEGDLGALLDVLCLVTAPRLRAHRQSVDVLRELGLSEPHLQTLVTSVVNVRNVFDLGNEETVRTYGLYDLSSGFRLRTAPALHVKLADELCVKYTSADGQDVEKAFPKILLERLYSSVPSAIAQNARHLKHCLRGHLIHRGVLTAETAAADFGLEVVEEERTYSLQEVSTHEH